MKRNRLYILKVSEKHPTYKNGKLTTEREETTIEEWGHTPAEASARAENAFPSFASKTLSCRPATTEEENAYLSEAAETLRQVEAAEREGSTKTLPRGWTIGRDGKTYDQCGEAV